MPERAPCPGCGKPPTVGSLHNVCVSDDRRYRYWLEASLSGDPGEVCLFLMLNPSKAGACRSDRTIDRCKEFAEQWGYGTLWGCNLYAFRSPKPVGLREALRHGENIVGYPVNNNHLVGSVGRADRIVLGWGGSGASVLGKDTFTERTTEVVQLLREAGAYDKLHVLCPPDRPCLTNGQPRHPKSQNPNDMPVEATECKRVRIGSDGTLTIAD